MPFLDDPNRADSSWQVEDNAVIAASGTVICDLNSDESEWREHARLIAAAPDLLRALYANLSAIQAVALHIPPQSASDVSAAGAITLAYEAIKLAECTQSERSVRRNRHVDH